MILGEKSDLEIVCAVEREKDLGFPCWCLDLDLNLSLHLIVVTSGKSCDRLRLIFETGNYNPHFPGL